MTNPGVEAAGPSERLTADSMFPAFTANDLEKSIKFYTEGLGFEVADETEMEGQLVFVMLKGGNVSLGLGRDDFKKGRDRVKGDGMRVWINTTQDINALAERAKSAGLTLDSEPEPLPWGPLAFAVTDPDGFRLTIANQE